MSHWGLHSLEDATVRPLAALDKQAWRRLWTDYLTFYQTSLSEDVFATTFSRLLGNDPHDFSCLIAEVGDQPVGLAHFLFHRHCWTQENTCYLQDLYVAPSARGKGIGRALIEAVYEAADQVEIPSVYWMTQQDNVAAQQLYDRIGEKTSFIKYKRV